MKKKYKSGPLEALYETVSGLHKIGLMTDEEMRFYDEGCLVKPAAPIPHTAIQESVAETGADLLLGGLYHEGLNHKEPQMNAS